MQMRIRIPLFLEFSDFDHGFRALVQKAQNLIVNPVDFLTMSLQVFRHDGGTPSSRILPRERRDRETIPSPRLELGQVGILQEPARALQG